MQIDIRHERLDSTPAAGLIAALNAELSGRYPEAGSTHFRLGAEEVEEDRGAFLVAYEGGWPVVCGALRQIDAATVEIKRMYATPETRGRGIAHAVLESLQTEARRLGAVRVLLETGVRQPEAVSFYLKAGFVRIAPFGGHLGSPLSVCMAKSLQPPAGERALGTPRLVLSPLAADDAEALFAYRAHPEVSRHQFFAPESIDDARAFIAAGSTEGSAWRQFGIRLRETAMLAGDVGYRPVPGDSQQAEIGITVAPEYQLRGFAAEAAAGLLDRLFGCLSSHRVFACVDPRNHASTRLFERLGFRREAHLRESTWFKGQWADDLIFALLAGEWHNRHVHSIESGSTPCDPT